MTDLRALLYEPWLPQEIKGPDFIGGPVKPPLATRMPEAVPAGMEHGGERWQLTPNDKDCFQMFAFNLINKQAELLFIGNAVDQYRTVTFALHGEKWSCIVLGHYGSGDSKVAALTAALHRLADERDAAKEM